MATFVLVHDGYHGGWCWIACGPWRSAVTTRLRPICPSTTPMRATASTRPPDVPTAIVLSRDDHVVQFESAVAAGKAFLTGDDPIVCRATTRHSRRARSTSPM